jgi:hypothetical protein
MSDRISAVSPRDYVWADLPSEREDFRSTVARSTDERTYGACHEPATVVGAALCGDQTALSNACRRAKAGTVDDILCDDPKLQEVQWWFTKLAEKAMELIVGAKMRLPR